MSAQIGIHASAQQLLDWLREPSHARHWLAQLRREAENLPSDIGLSPGAGESTIRWSASPAGEFQVEDKGETAELTLVLDDARAPGDPPEADADGDPDARAEDALRSIKSHVEGMGGGDPTTHDPRPVPSRLIGESATFDPDL